MDQAEKLRNIIKVNNQTQAGHAQSGHARVITVTSGKGGVGKSSISINLAMEMRKMGKEVIIFDADFGLANIEVMFGAIPKYNLSDLIYKGKNIKDILLEGPGGVKFISGGSGIAGLGNLTKEQVSFLGYKLKELEEMADVIIIDTGAGISDSVLEFVSLSSEVILVTTPEPTSITDSYALLKALSAKEGFDKENMTIKMITNRVTSQEDGQNLYQKLSTVVNKFLTVNVEWLGYVPFDGYMQKAVMQQKPVSLIFPNVSAAKALHRIAGKLDGQEEEEQTKRGLSQMIWSLFKSKQ